MSCLVNPELLDNFKPFSTHITLKWFLSCVYPVVKPEVLSGCIQSSTLSTDEGFLLLMSPYVHLQLMLHGEPLRTLLIHKHAIDAIDKWWSTVHTEQNPAHVLAHMDPNPGHISSLTGRLRLLGKPQLTLGPKNRTKSDFFDEFQTKNGVNLGKWSEFGRKSEKSDPLGGTASN